MPAMRLGNLHHEGPSCAEHTSVNVLPSHAVEVIRCSLCSFQQRPAHDFTHATLGEIPSEVARRTPPPAARHMPPVRRGDLPGVLPISPGNENRRRNNPYIPTCRVDVKLQLRPFEIHGSARPIALLQHPSEAFLQRSRHARFLQGRERFPEVNPDDEGGEFIAFAHSQYLRQELLGSWKAHATDHLPRRALNGWLDDTVRIRRASFGASGTPQ